MGVTWVIATKQCAMRGQVYFFLGRTQTDGGVHGGASDTGEQAKL